MRYILLIFSSCLAFTGQAQVRPTQTKTIQMVRRYIAPASTSYTAVVKDMGAIRNTGKADTVKPTFSTRLAMLHLQDNIVPTEGSVALLCKLNPEFQTGSSVSANYKVRTPHFTPASPALLRKSQLEYLRLKVPNPTDNDQFRTLTNTFNSNFQMLAGKFKFDQGFADTSNIFSGTVLPGINSQASTISQAQMQYFNTELGHINDLMQSVLANNRVFDDVSFSLIEMMGDFMEVTGWSKPMQFKARKNHGPASTGSQLQLDVIKSLYDLSDNPSNVDVYVYNTDKNGVPATEPTAGTYDVYYDSNGFIFSLTPGCDTVSFFSNHPADYASTLPVILGRGNYCIAIRNNRNHRTFIQPNINLASGGNYDENNRLKVVFTIYDPE